MPIFRSFPRVGIPPHFADWADYEQRIEFMVRSGLIADYTYLWYDVRPHPRLGTVEIRAMDAQTRVEHTVAHRRADPDASCKELVEEYHAGRTSTDYRLEILDENKWIAARHGLDAELVVLPEGERAPVRQHRRAGSLSGSPTTRPSSAASPSCA